MKIQRVHSIRRISFIGGCHKPAGAAFTATELLAVVGAIGLVAALCLPALANTHLKSAFTVCLGNQRQLIQSVQSFAQDNQDALVPTQYVEPNGTTVALGGGGYWPGPAEEISHEMSRERAAQSVKSGLQQGPLWQYVESTEVFHCPGDVRASLRLPGAGWGYDSYSKSETIAGGAFDAGTPPFRRLSQVPDTSNCFVFCEEADPRDYNLGTWVMGAVTPFGWVDSFGAFHDGGAMFSFLDGHADFYRWRDQRMLKAAADSMKGLAAFFPEGGNVKNPDFRWVRDRYQHLNWKPL